MNVMTRHDSLDSLSQQYFSCTSPNLFLYVQLFNLAVNKDYNLKDYTMLNKPLLSWLLFTCCYTIAFLVQPVIPQNNTCFPVQQCSSTPNVVDTLVYILPVQNWEMGRSGVCPKSDDSGVSMWQIRFERNSMTVSGNFCSIGISFNSSTMCYDATTRSLVFLDVKNNKFSGSGDVIIQFNETNNDGNSAVFEAQFPVTYRPTGVYAAKQTVQYVPDDMSGIPPSITWRVYNNINDIKLYFNGVLIANETIPNVFISETTACFDSTPSPDIKTSVHTLFIHNPSIESAGNYTLVIGGSYSATTMLVLDPAYVTPPTPQPNVHVSMSKSAFTSFMPPVRPTADALSSGNYITFLAIVIVGILYVTLTVIVCVVILVITGIYNRRNGTKRSSTNQPITQLSTISLPTSHTHHLPHLHLDPPPSNTMPWPPQAPATNNRSLPDDHTHQIPPPQSSTPPPPSFLDEDTDEDTDHVPLSNDSNIEGDDKGNIIHQIAPPQSSTPPPPSFPGEDTDKDTNKDIDRVPLVLSDDGNIKEDDKGNTTGKEEY